MREREEEVNGVNPLEAASGLGHLSKYLDWRHSGEEGDLVLERAEPGQVDELEKEVVDAAINGALARLIPWARRPVLFLSTERGVVGLEVGVVVLLRRDLAVVQYICRDGDLVAGVLEDGAGEVVGVGAFKCDLNADIDEVLLEFDNMVVIWSARYFCLIATRFCKEAGDFNNRSHSDGAGVGGEGTRWLLGGASVGASVGLLVGSSVGRILGQERRREVGQDIGQSQCGSIIQSQRGSIGRGLSQRQRGCIGRSLHFE